MPYPIRYGNEPDEPLYGSPRRGGSSTIVDLIRDQGRVQAEGALRSGDILANTFSNVGQQLAGGIMQASEEKKIKAAAAELATQDAAFVKRLNSGQPMGPRDFVSIYGPDKGMKMAGAYGQLQQPKPDVRLVAAGFDSQSDPMKAMSYPNVRQSLVTAMPELAEVMPPEFDLEWWGKIKPQILGEKAGGEEYTLNQGDRRFRGEKMIAENPAEVKPPSYQHVETARGIEAFNPQTGKVEGGVVAQSKPPAARELTPTAEMHGINKLTAQWDKAVAPVVELDRQLGFMRDGMQAARKGDLNAGQQAVLVTFQKILDPGSVVKESEYARSAAGQAALARIQGAFDRITKGGAGFTMPELEQFESLAADFVKRASSGYIKAVKDRVGRNADHLGIKRDLIFADYEFGGGGVAPTAPGAPPPAAGGGQEITATGPNGQKLVLRNGQWVPQ